ncbi:MAG: MG2 domain-containing protein [Bacteroidota bacterium]
MMMLHKTLNRWTLAASLLLLAVFLLQLTACRPGKEAAPMPESISSYVYAYTSGMISKADPIRIRFVDAVIGEEDKGGAVGKGILTFRPAIKGQAVWENDRTLLFEPEEELLSGKKYVGQVALTKLFEKLPADLKNFEFGFQTKRQSFDFSFNGLQGLDATDLSKQSYRGTIYTADVADVTQVEALLSAEQQGRSLPIVWEHDADRKRHDFQINDIKRGEQDSELQLSWTGKALGVDEKDSKTISIPSINDFELMDVDVVQDGDQYLRLYFSDPLLKSQDLKGLVRITGYSGKLRFNIEGTQLLVYPATQVTGNHQLIVEPGIRNVAKSKMDDQAIFDLTFTEVKPQVRLAGQGSILPSSSSGLLFPFEAINLSAVDVEIFKVYNNNLLQYLQTNQSFSNYDLERVGRIVFQKKVNLNTLNASGSSQDWTAYALDLGNMIATDRQAIYQVRLGFRPNYSTYDCGSNGEGEEEDLTVMEDPFDEEGEIKSIMNTPYYGPGGYYDGFRWEHRDDPCYPAYYNPERFVRSNVFASDLGIIAKSAATGEMTLAVNNIRTTEPVSGVSLQFYDYQQQPIGEATTDAQGMAAVDLSRKPFVVIANKGEQHGYLRLLDADALSLSKFDVAGQTSQKGIKGYIYGERGVWRPGDSLYLNFVLEDKGNRLPSNHPIAVEVFDPRNQSYQKFSSTNNVNKVYPLRIATHADAPTGNWRAQVKVGGATFNKYLKIETVKPNRLKIKVDMGEGDLAVQNLPAQGSLQVNWLHGAPARGLNTKIEAQLRPVPTRFDQYKDYQFDDPARTFNARPRVVFEEAVNDAGQADFDIKLPRNNNNIPGKLKASFKVRAFEKGGDFSEDNFSKTYHPFEQYAGIAIPKNRYGSKRLEFGKPKNIDFVLVDQEGKVVPNKQLNVGLYRVDWRWWWDNGRRSRRSNYNTSTHLNALKSENLRTNSKGKVSWPVEVNDWGRYMIRICDEESGHCSGDYFYAGYPWYDSEDNSQHREAAAMLVFSSDKDKYNVGEKVELRIPGSKAGKALITIESGEAVMESYWTSTSTDETRFEFYTTAEMAPTVYAHVTLLQPHAQVENDLPIRMYGVIPIHVEDPDTRLKPTIKMKDVLAPKEKVKIEVAESKGKAMTYTIAMVDEGLLDLTRFKTPNPWNSFYARQALGVKTWDMYNEVLGTYGGQMDQLLGIGGDGGAEDELGNKKANRFEPVVRHLGPFYLDRGGKAVHEIEMPNYVGSVRTMVVAAREGAYGSAEKTTPVRKPLMVLATLPRVLGPGERLSLPVNVFAMENKVKSATVSVREESGLVRINGGDQQSISFARPGDEMINFDLEVGDATGVAKFIVEAKGAGETSSQEIEIDIRNPNPYMTEIRKEVVAAGDVWTTNLQPIGTAGTNAAVLEVSSIPPLDLENRLRYLIRYPHGCVEQTTSAAFPQLFVDRLIDLNEEQKEKINTNIKFAINKLRDFQTSSGGFGYWPGNEDESHWATNYVGHFLFEAQKAGYSVSNRLIDNWKRFQKRSARIWNPRTNNNGYYRGNVELEQAYRLYTLALAGEPDLGAMNRLRERKLTNSNTRYRLAAAYALAGKEEAARQLIQDVAPKVEEYTELSYTYGSGLRDRAMILETLVVLKDNKAASELAQVVAQNMNSEGWYGTHSLSYGLVAMAQFADQNKIGEDLRFVYQVESGPSVNAGSKRPVFLVDLPVETSAGKALKVKNTSEGTLYARVVYTGQPMVGYESEGSNNLKMSVAYQDLKGQSLDPTTIEQGTDFVAIVSIRNPGTRADWYKEMALTQIFPSGWEILNSRMSSVSNASGNSRLTYQDVRDDRVHSYFDIYKNKTRSYRLQLNAAYQGRFYLPGVNCEAMYDNTINAHTAGQWVEVTAPKAL